MTLSIAQIAACSVYFLLILLLVAKYFYDYGFFLGKRRGYEEGSKAMADSMIAKWVADKKKEPGR